MDAGGPGPGLVAVSSGEEATPRGQASSGYESNSEATPAPPGPPAVGSPGLSLESRIQCILRGAEEEVMKVHLQSSHW